MKQEESKMLEDRIKELTAAVEALTAAMLEAQPAKADAPKPKAEKPKVEKTKEEMPKEEKPKAEAPKADFKMSMDDLTRMCLGLARDGHRDAIKEKLSSLNVNRVGELEGDAFETFSDWAIELAERAEVTL